MRTIRTMLLLGAAALLAAGVAMAAGRANGAPRGPICTRVTSQLGLTDAQKTQARDLWAKYRQEFQALRAEKLDVDGRRARAREIAAKMRGEFSALLTPEQRDKLSKLSKEWTKHLPRDARKASVDRVMDRAARELDLTAEQREKVRAVYARHEEEIRTLVGDARAADADTARIWERARALKGTVEAEVLPILTPEQQQKLRTMIEGWEKKHQG